MVTGGLLAGAFLIYVWALTRVGVTAAAAALTLIPAFALVLSSVIVGELLTITAIVSTGLILTGLAVHAHTARGRSHPA